MIFFHSVIFSNWKKRFRNDWGWNKILILKNMVYLQKSKSLGLFLNPKKFLKNIIIVYMTQIIIKNGYKSNFAKSFGSADCVALYCE